MSKKTGKKFQKKEKTRAKIDTIRENISGKNRQKSRKKKIPKHGKKNPTYPIGVSSIHFGQKRAVQQSLYLLMLYGV